MKYKVGDKVRVREDLIHGREYGGITFYMDGCKGKIVTISFVCSSNYYEIAEDEDKWNWTDEMFEDIVENKNKKYKVGDKVKIREDLVADEEYGEIDYISDMDKWKGKIVTISFVDNDNNCYGIAEDTERWTWSAGMFEDVPENNVGEIKARTVDVGYCLKPYGHRMIGNVYQGVDNNGKLFFTTVDGLNQYIIPKDAIDWIIPHPQEVYI
jgi:hypothetical protein